MIQGRILDLVDYALATDLITEEDKVYTINRLLELFCLEELEDDKVNAHKNICKTREEAEMPCLRF